MLKNIYLNLEQNSEQYFSKPGRGPGGNIPNRDSFSHATKLKNEFDAIWEKTLRESEQRSAVSLPTKDGVYLQFTSSPGYDLITKSLESMSKGIRLLNIQSDDENTTKATVFIPNGTESYFLNKLNKYIETADIDKPKNKTLINSINSISLAIIESFWTSDKKKIPHGEKEWCEVWLASYGIENTDVDQALLSFKQVANDLNIEVAKETLNFPERKVILIKANYDDLKELIERNSNIAEIRNAPRATMFFLDLEQHEQKEWIDELKKRIIINETADTQAISILDSGINKHPLIDDFFVNKGIISYDSNWGTHDGYPGGHGTQMSGICLYDNLQSKLESSENIEITHKLESAKILPNSNQKNDPLLYGAITSNQIEALIINNPYINRVFCMAVTEDFDYDDGRPSSWSAQIDNITYARIDELKKLILISAGNIEDVEAYKQYPNSNTIYSVKSPGQAWNAITVGAFTEKVYHDTETNVTSLAEIGALSPFSTTSIMWQKKWPIKPEVLFEGGNVLVDRFGPASAQEVSELTISSDTIKHGFFDTIRATSLATAKASNFAVRLYAQYPNYRVETIRGLMIHSATWTSEMLKLIQNNTRKSDYAKLLRICGYGIPSFERAVECRNNDVNMIIESELQPFGLLNNEVKMKDMMIFDVPWPKNILENNFDKKVEMKVTLSYFIEPGPGEIGWKDRYRYPSCGLRFDVNGGLARNEFKRKISRIMDEEIEDNDSNTESGVQWKLGPNARNVGSIHSDIWLGTAGEIANANYIAVYPVSGWWKERKHLKKYNEKIQFSLVVSLKIDDEEIDLYNEILTIIENKNKVIIETK